MVMVQYMPQVVVMLKAAAVKSYTADDIHKIKHGKDLGTSDCFA